MRELGLVVEVGQFVGEVIQNDKTKELFTWFSGQGCAWSGLHRLANDGVIQGNMVLTWRRVKSWSVLWLRIGPQLFPTVVVIVYISVLLRSTNVILKLVSWRWRVIFELRLGLLSKIAGGCALNRTTRKLVCGGTARYYRCCPQIWLASQRLKMRRSPDPWVSLVNSFLKHHGKGSGKWRNTGSGKVASAVVVMCPVYCGYATGSFLSDTKHQQKHSQHIIDRDLF